MNRCSGDRMLLPSVSRLLLLQLELVGPILGLCFDIWDVLFNSHLPNWSVAGVDGLGRHDDSVRASVLS